MSRNDFLFARTTTPTLCTTWRAPSSASISNLSCWIPSFSPPSKPTCISSRTHRAPLRHSLGLGFSEIGIRWWYGHPPLLMPQSARHERGTRDGDLATRHSSSGFWLDEWCARVLEGASRGCASFVAPPPTHKCEGVNGPPRVCAPPARHDLDQAATN